MNQTTLAILIGFVAGVVGGYFGQSLAGTKSGAESTLESDEAEALREEIAALRASLAGDRASGATLAAREGAPEVLVAEADRRSMSVEEEAALLARLDERVEKAVSEKLAEMKTEGGERPGRGARRAKKRLSLHDAAIELELTAQQEDELARIYAEQERKVLEMLAKPDGDPEEVKREIQEAAKTPGGAQKMMGKYMPKVIGNIGTIMTMQAEREAAVVKTLGPEKAKRLQNEFTVEEDDFLGLGGGQMQFGASVQVDDR